MVVYSEVSGISLALHGEEIWAPWLMSFKYHICSPNSHSGQQQVYLEHKNFFNVLKNKIVGDHMLHQEVLNSLIR